MSKTYIFIYIYLFYRLSILKSLLITSERHAPVLFISGHVIIFVSLRIRTYWSSCHHQNTFFQVMLWLLLLVVWTRPKCYFSIYHGFNVKNTTLYKLDRKFKLLWHWNYSKIKNEALFTQLFLKTFTSNYISIFSKLLRKLRIN